MDFKAACARILFVATCKLAHKGFHASVGEFVRLQVALGDELLATLGAGKGSFPCVGPHVCLKVACFLKLLQASVKRTNEQLYFIFRTFYSLNH